MLTDWDPSKWIILLLHFFGLVCGLRRAKDEDIKNGLEHMRMKEQGEAVIEEEEDIPIWSSNDVENFTAKENRCLILLDGYIVDTTSYLSEHVSAIYLVECRAIAHHHIQQPGGSKLMREYALKNVRIRAAPHAWPDASVAFHGGINIHSWAANQQVKKLRIAKFQS